MRVRIAGPFDDGSFDLWDEHGRILAFGFPSREAAAAVARARGWTLYDPLDESS